MTANTWNIGRPPRHENGLDVMYTSVPYRYHPAIPTFAGFFAGAALGVSHGSQTASLRFRAENAHRLPTTTTGWYLYHKSKNYHMMFGAAKEGLKMGSRIGLWVAAFFTMESAIDHISGKQSFASTTVAGLSIAGASSGLSMLLSRMALHRMQYLTNAIDRFPLITAARTAKLGLLGGLVFGLFQDGLSLAKGDRPFYVDALLGVSRGQKVSVDGGME